MRFKISLNVHPEEAGAILPVSYQYELAATIHRLLNEDKQRICNWLAANNLTIEDSRRVKLYSLSNLYVPRVFVEGDRLHINVPRVQFWISFAHDNGTEEFIRTSLSNRKILLGDKKSRVAMQIGDISIVSSVEFEETMDFQSMSPVVVTGMRPNGSVEFLDPQNPVFNSFMFEGLIERWEYLNRKPWTGSRDFQLTMIQEPRRKGIYVHHFSPQEQKVIGYLIKFHVTMDVQLQKLAYELGIGDRIEQGFGYLELLNKKSE